MSERVWWTHRVRAAVAVRGPARAVLYALADRADEAGCSWPGQAQLADDAGVTDRTVRDALRGLVAGGYLSHAGRDHGVDRWRLTIADDGAPTGATIAPDRKDVPLDPESTSAPEGHSAPEAPSGATGSSFRRDRKPVPLDPEGGSDKGAMKGPLKGTGKGERAHTGAAGEPTQPTIPPRRNLHGRRPMPPALTDEEAERRRSLVDVLAERWRANTGEAPILADRDALFGLLALVTADESEAGLVVDLLTTGARGAGWDNPPYLAASGLRWTLDRHADRLLSWARAWARAGRPIRDGVAGKPAAPAVQPAAAAWLDMLPRLAGSRAGAYVAPHNPGGIMLADDLAEHDRRRRAWLPGSCAAWSMTENDFQRRDLRDAWQAAYVAVVVPA